MIPSTIAMNAVVTVPASPTVNPAGAPAAAGARRREAEQVREMIGEPRAALARLMNHDRHLIGAADQHARRPGRRAEIST